MGKNLTRNIFTQNGSRIIIYASSVYHSNVLTVFVDCILANRSGHVCICTLYDVECLIPYFHLLNFREVIPMS